MTNEEIYTQGYAISGQDVEGFRTFRFREEVISIPSHHIMIELLEDYEVVDINRVREVEELYKQERI